MQRNISCFIVANGTNFSHTYLMTKLITELFDISKTIAGENIGKYDYPWDILNDLPMIIDKLSLSLDMRLFDRFDNGIFIAKNAIVSSSANIIGPCIIDENAEIRHSAFIRGSAIIGKNAVIGNSVEVKNAIIFDEAEIPHFNYVGDSIIGYKAHLAGGVITSNVKIDKSNIKIKLPDASFDSHRMKVGAFVADYAEIGCNSVLNPGTIISRYSRVYPLTSVRGFIPPHMIVKDNNTIIPLN